MTQGNDKNQDLARLESVLEIFGADPKRWPTSDRCNLEALIEKNADAGLLLREARALAQVMDAAHAPQASAALKSRIAAAVVEAAGREANIVPIQMPARRASALWPAAALAASFALGLYLGVAGIGGTAVDGAFEIAAYGIAGSDENAISWLDDGGIVSEDSPL